MLRPDAPEVVVLTHKPDAPSFRHRLRPVLPELEARGFRASVEVMPSGPLMLRVLERRRRLSSAAAVVLAKTKLHPPETWLLQRSCQAIVYDVDDAVYTVHPRRAGHRPPRSPLRRWRFAALCRAADLVLACNEVLAARARLHAPRVEVVPWSEDGEVEALRGADIGIMPLFDDDWSNGKCAFKIIQYMAAGLPCVASRTAMNCEVVSHGHNGFLASTTSEWEDRLRTLLVADDRGRSLGRAGRQLVEQRFNRRLVAPHTAELIASVARAEPEQ